MYNITRCLSSAFLPAATFRILAALIPRWRRELTCSEKLSCLSKMTSNQPLRHCCFIWSNVHYCGWFARCNGFLLWSCLLAESHETINHCTFVKHLFTNNLMFEHGGGKLVFCLRRHLTLLRPCAMHITIV